MLSKPWCGWTTVHIGDWEGSASYLTSVPFDVLESMIFSLENCVPFSVEFDAEGWSFIVVSTDYESYVIEYKDEPILYHFDIDKVNLAQEILIDLGEHRDLWLKWEDEEIDKEKSEIFDSQMEKLDKLVRRRLDEYTGNKYKQ